ncbi:YraN family protein [Nitrogeniibacter mangrovi]|uniref:UPF0102 protein G3580_04815 n=1 Tax=Nitrogeniibacter mangrovi TaxID=2016596 RepID=A0A6C1B0A3_9RHOO|nr:YraN family protein [Nitrogeniibacter mangrovi]QID17022.1 YraN family protein [Nitrogeniibacter mangrovi]
MRAVIERLKGLIVRPRTPARQADGQRAEAAAERFLVREGLRTLARNYRCREGEIDLVCRHGRVVVFVEVRLRRRADYGGAAGSVTPAKRRRIICAARHWLVHAGHGRRAPPCRFDVISMQHPDDPHPDWIRAAFDADARV